MSREEDDRIAEILAGVSVPSTVQPAGAGCVPASRTSRSFAAHDVQSIASAIDQARRLLANVGAMTTCPARLRRSIADWCAYSRITSDYVMKQPMPSTNVDGVRTLAQRGVALLHDLPSTLPKMLPTTRRNAADAADALARVIDLLAQPAGQSATILDRADATGAQRAAAL